MPSGPIADTGVDQTSADPGFPFVFFVFSLSFFLNQLHSITGSVAQVISALQRTSSYICRELQAAGTRLSAAIKHCFVTGAVTMNFHQ